MFADGGRITGMWQAPFMTTKNYRDVAGSVYEYQELQGCGRLRL